MGCLHTCQNIIEFDTRTFSLRRDKYILSDKVMQVFAQCMILELLAVIVSSKTCKYTHDLK